MPDYSETGKLSLFPYDTRFRPIAPPQVGIFEEPQVSICMNVQWAAHIDGVLERLLWPDAWLGDDDTKTWAVGEARKLIVSLMMRNPCGGGDCMGECCDDIITRLEAIEDAINNLAGVSPKQIRESINEFETAYEGYIDQIETVYQDDITNVHPDMAYGDSNDPIRDQALCFICNRFVNICCDWIVRNIQLKQANQQTVLNLAQIIGGAADLLGRFFAETAFGPMFQNIDIALELEVAALTTWITTVSEAQLTIFQNQTVRDQVACEWYEGLKGQTPTLALFKSSLTGASLTGDADTMRDKIAGALVPVDVARDPDPEHVFFIWADLWQEAYEGAQAGIVPECGCEEVNPCTHYLDFVQSANGFTTFQSNTAAYGTRVQDEGLKPGTSQFAFVGTVPVTGVYNVIVEFNAPWAGQMTWRNQNGTSTGPGLLGTQLIDGKHVVAFAKAAMTSSVYFGVTVNAGNNPPMAQLRIKSVCIVVP